jgi:CheY-like chemotaxis protein
MMYEARPVLLVEDNPFDVDLTRRAFMHLKVKNPLEIARDGQEAIDLLEGWDQNRPHPVLILLDIKLPKIDGLEVLKRIKEHPEYRVLPVVILTSSGQESDVVKAYQLGANSYILKPVNFDEFINLAADIHHYWLSTNKAPF